MDGAAWSRNLANWRTLLESGGDPVDPASMPEGGVRGSGIRELEGGRVTQRR